MNAEIITLFIALMGGATVLLSLWVAWRFWWHYRNLTGDGKKLSVALFFQLVGEACIGAVTLVFAVLAWSDHLKGVPAEVQSGLRFVAFFATSATTLHLARVVEKLHTNK